MSGCFSLILDEYLVLILVSIRNISLVLLYPSHCILSTHPSIHPSIHSPTHPFIHPPIHPPTHFSSTHPSTLSTHPFFIHPFHPPIFHPPIFHSTNTLHTNKRTTHSPSIPPTATCAFDSYSYTGAESTHSPPPPDPPSPTESDTDVARTADPPRSKRPSYGPPSDTCDAGRK